MSSTENELTIEEPCKKCNGWGYTSVTFHQDSKYFIVCDKCYGRKRLDWITAARGLDFDDAAVIIRSFEEHLFPGNFILNTPERVFYIKRGFFDATKHSEKWKHVHVKFTANVF